jgi:hypothetical protein
MPNIWTQTSFLLDIERELLIQSPGQEQEEANKSAVIELETRGTKRRRTDTGEGLQMIPSCFFRFL